MGRRLGCLISWLHCHSTRSMMDSLVVNPQTRNVCDTWFTLQFDPIDDGPASCESSEKSWSWSQWFTSSLDSIDDGTASSGSSDPACSWWRWLTVRRLCNPSTVEIRLVRNHELISDWSANWLFYIGKEINSLKYLTWPARIFYYLLLRWLIFGLRILLSLRNSKSSAGSGRDNYKSQLGVVGGKIIKSTAAVSNPRRATPSPNYPNIHPLLSWIKGHVELNVSPCSADV